MTWFIEVGGTRKPQGFVTGYKNTQKKKQYLVFRYETGPFPPDWRDRVPARVEFAVTDKSGPLHIICDSVGYIFFSDPALSALKALQKDGFETFPLVASTENNADDKLQSEIYHLVNPFREMFALDVDRSSFDWPDGDRKRSPILGEERRVVLRDGVRIPDFSAERELFFRRYFFFSNRLKVALCDLGTNPDIFDACI